MIRQVTLVLLVVALCGVAAAIAAPAPQYSGKVVAVEEGTVKIAIQGEKPDWVRKNAGVKFANGVGKVIEVSAADATPVVMTVKTKLASTMKVDDVVTFEKGRSMAGC